MSENKDQVKVSIIVPVYNIEEYLPECMDSLLNQTLREIEIICVNDGSTDHSLEVLREYERRDSRVKILSIENGGPGRARNCGVECACGEYIGFVDGDDFIDTYRFSRLYEKAAKFDADVAFGNVYLYYPDTGDKNLFRDYRYCATLDSLGEFTAKSQPRILTFVGLWDRIFKRSFWLQHGIKNPEGRFYEDHLPSFQASVLAEKMVFVNEPHYYYRQNRKGSTINQEVAVDFYKFQFLTDYQEVRNFLIEQGVYERYRRVFLEYKLSFAIAHQNNLHGWAMYQKYFEILCGLLDKEDYELAKSLGFYNANRHYLQCLQRNHPLPAYIRLKLSKLCHRDYLFIYWRLPKMKNYFKIRRSHFFWRTEFAALHREFQFAHTLLAEGLEKNKKDMENEEKH